MCQPRVPRAHSFPWNRSAAKYNHRVDVALHEFLVRLCLECSPPRYTFLHHLIQYHVIEASRVIARMLLQGEAPFCTPGLCRIFPICL